MYNPPIAGSISAESIDSKFDGSEVWTIGCSLRIYSREWVLRDNLNYFPDDHEFFVSAVVCGRSVIVFSSNEENKCEEAIKKLETFCYGQAAR